MKILGFDTETTGLDPQKDEIVEVGAVLFDADIMEVVRVTGYLVKPKRPIPSEASKVNGITNEMLEKYGVESRAGLQAFLALAKHVDFYLAHNAPFDKSFLEAWCARENMPMVEKPWINTQVDLPVEAYEKGANLFVMAARHGFLYDAHRAVNDVLA